MNTTVQLFFEILSQKSLNYRKHLHLFFLFFLLLQFTAHSQNVDLRNLTLNSDVILFVEQSDYEYSTEFINDHFNKNYIKIKNFPKILKNSTNIKFINKEIHFPTENNDFYDNAKIAGGDCVGIGEPTEPNKKYYSILFLRKKDKKQLILLAHFSKSSYNWGEIIEKINDISFIEKAKSHKETYEKSIDFYLKHNELPEYAFREYYKYVKILKSDTLELNKAQLLLAKEKFMAGNERYYELVKNDYPKEIISFYIAKMKKIKATENIEEISFYDFEDAFEKATNTNFMDDSELGKSKRKLTDDIPFEEKQKIMEALIKSIEK